SAFFSEAAAKTRIDFSGGLPCACAASGNATRQNAAVSAATKPFRCNTTVSKSIARATTRSHHADADVDCGWLSGTVVPARPSARARRTVGRILMIGWPSAADKRWADRLIWLFPL